MKFAASSTQIGRLLSAISFLLVLASLFTGCGSSGSAPSKLSGNTNVTVLLSSAANDQLTEFDIGLQSISLTSQLGKEVSLLSLANGQEQGAEFIHVNGGIDPLLTLSVPQDVYTAATIGVDQSDFACATLTPDGGLATSFFQYGATSTNAPSTNVTVSMPSPITVTGDHMALLLELQTLQSANYSSCYSQGIQQWSITPTFNVTPVALSAQPTNAGNGKAFGIDGQITAMNTNGSLTLTLPEGPRTLSINTNSATTYQGVSGYSALADGLFVETDGAIQTDGSLLATRIAVQDLSAVQTQIGPVLQTNESEPVLFMWGRLQQGTALQALGAQAFSLANAAFQVSGQFSNLQSLPFVPSFDYGNMVPGQTVYLTADTLVSSGGYPYTPATTVTLIPQTVDGTVIASSAAGNFTDYTVSLAPYDLFPTLAVQQGQASLLTSPNQIEVYVDGNTQMLNTKAIAAGNTMRFYGLIFNDNGTLRMDCGQVNDGVPFSSTSGSSADSSGVRTSALRSGFGGINVLETKVTRTR